MTTRETYIEVMKHQLDELNAEMARLESNTENAKVEIREKYKDEVATLRHQSKLSLAKLDELMAANDGIWESMVADMERMRDAYSHAFHFFKSEFWILLHCPQPPEVRLGVRDVNRWDRLQA